MARTLDQIIAELNPTYDPQLQSLRQRQTLIPQQVQEEERGLQARQEQAFGDILGGARRRGLGFSGIPIAEQARYTSTEFLPALARLRQQGKEQAMSLEDAILGITERRNTLAQQLQQQDYQRDLAERQMAEQRRQFEENLRQAEINRQHELTKVRMAAASGGGAGGGGTPTPVPTNNTGSGGGGQPTPPKAFYSYKDPRNAAAGFAFKDAQGKDISALQYARLTGTPFNEVVNRMAAAGDRGAHQIKQFATKSGVAQIFAPQYANLVRAFTWGV